MTIKQDYIRTLGNALFVLDGTINTEAIDNLREYLKRQLEKAENDPQEEIN